MAAIYLFLTRKVCVFVSMVELSKMGHYKKSDVSIDTQGFILTEV